MTLTRIFLDLDDVCNTFTLSALREVGCPVGPWDYDNYDPRWGFNIVKAANALHPNCEFGATGFWNSLSRKFWATIPKSGEFDMLLKECEALVGRKEMCILSSPTLDPDCAAGKMEWIYKNLPTWLHRQFLIGPPKHFCARPDAVLIDDSDANVKAFRDYGGQAILMPRPWNKHHHLNAKAYLRGEFMCLCLRQRLAG